MITSLLACICGLTVTAQTYELVVLDDGTSESGAYGVNNYGFTCGYKVVNGNPVPYLWSPAKGYLQLSQPSGSVSGTGIAYSIDDSFDVVGTYGYFGTLPYHISSGTGAFWTFDPSSGFLPGKVPDAPVCARDVNNSGDIVGYNSGGTDFGYTWNVFDGTSYQAYWGFIMFFSINEAGSVTGCAPGSYPYSPVFVRKETNGSRTVFSGANIGGGIYLPSAGYKVNTNNQVVGTANSQGFYWEPETGSNTLFGGDTCCYSINNSKLIVGTTNGHACMWKPTKTGFSVVDLNSLTGNTNFVLNTAFGVNDKGQIVGQATSVATGVQSAFMLTPSTGVMPTLSKRATNSLVLNWSSIDSHVYAIHTSTDLKTWTTLPDVYLAAGTNAWVTIIADQPKMFFTVSDQTP